MDITLLENGPNTIIIKIVKSIHPSQMREHTLVVKAILEAMS